MTDVETKVQHTPGPLVRDGYNMAALLKCVAERGSPRAMHTCGDYEKIATFHGDNWDANARRGLALWNACAGIPTEALESNALGHVRAALIFIIDQVEKCQPVDELGHRFCMNQSYFDAKAALARLEGRS